MLLSGNGGMQNAKNSSRQIGTKIKNLNVLKQRNVRRMIDVNNKARLGTTNLGGIAYSKL